MASAAAPARAVQEKLAAKNPAGKIGMIIFGVAILIGLVYTVISVASDMGTVHATSVFPFILLGVALAHRAGI